VNLPERHEPQIYTAKLVAWLRRPGLICLLLAASALAVFGPAMSFEFLNYDDPEYVTANPHVLRGLTPSGVVWAFGTGHAGNWHPLTWVSHMLDATLFGSIAAGPHLVNALLHAANAALLFLALRRLTGAHVRSALAAELFALHPLRVESVAWIAERKDVLSVLFWLLTLLAYARAWSKAEGRESKAGAPALDLRPSTSDYRLALLFFALGLMSKPMVVTLPFVLLLLDFWPLGRFKNLATGLQLVKEKLLFFLLSALGSLVTFAVQKQIGAVHSLAGLPLGARLANAFVACARYLGKLFWPVDLFVPYPHPGQWPPVLVICSVALVTGLSAAALIWRRQLPFVFTGWFWFLGTLIPVIGLVQVGIQSLADRYTYLPSIGVCIILVWGAAAVWERWRLPKILAGGAAALALAAGAARTADQLRYWQNSGSLFSHALVLSKNNYLAYDNLGFYQFKHGRLEEALENYHHALQINPGDANTLNNLGSALFHQGKILDALQAYEAALRARPDFAEAHINLAVLLDQAGRSVEAEVHDHEALRLDPDNAAAHNNLAKILFSRGARPEAIQEFRRALALNPAFTEALNNLGLALAMTGQLTAAENCFERLLRLQPGDTEARVNFGRVLAAERRTGEAAVQFTEALRLKPDYAEAKAELEKLNARQTK